MRTAVGRVFWYVVRIVFVFAALSLSPVRYAQGQETVNNASLSGTVTDPSTGTVANAPVIARRIETDVTVDTTTDNAGRFRFPYLPVGQYE